VRAAIENGAVDRAKKGGQIRQSKAKFIKYAILAIVGLIARILLESKGSPRRAGRCGRMSFHSI
jgi:hypothetical protein